MINQCKNHPSIIDIKIEANLNAGSYDLAQVAAA